MLRIGVCEDDSKYRESLAFLLEKYLHHRENDLIIEEFSTGDALLQWLEKHQGSWIYVFWILKCRERTDGNSQKHPEKRCPDAAGVPYRIQGVCF